MYLRKRLVSSAACALATIAPTFAVAQVAPLRVFGFGDVGYLVTERETPAGFRIGQIAGHGIAGLTPRLNFFGELTVTASSSGYWVEVQRLILRHDFSDHFKLSAGRYHPPVSYWNAAYHHGQWLQTSAGRPEMVRFGSPLLPVHFIGVMAEGSFPQHPLNPGYTVGVGNGRQQHMSRAGDAGDINSQRALLANAQLRPRSLPGLGFGGSLYVDRIDVADTDGVDERIAAAFLALETRGPEVIAEYANIQHRDRFSGRTEVAAATYVQVAYRLPGTASALRPYARVESVQPGVDPVVAGFADLDYRAVLGGVRFDIAPMAAVKLEVRNERSLVDGWARTLLLQVSFALGPTEEPHDHAVASTATPEMGSRPGR